MRVQFFDHMRNGWCPISRHLAKLGLDVRIDEMRRLKQTVPARFPEPGVPWEPYAGGQLDALSAVSGNQWLQNQGFLWSYVM